MTRARLSLALGRLGGTIGLTLILALAFSCLLGPAAFAGRTPGKKPGANPAGVTNPPSDDVGSQSDADDAGSQSSDERANPGELAEGEVADAPTDVDAAQQPQASASVEGEKLVVTDALIREIATGMGELWVKEKARLAAKEAAETERARREAEMEALAVRADAGDVGAVRQLFALLQEHLAELNNRARNGDREALMEAQAIAQALQEELGGGGQSAAQMLPRRPHHFAAVPAEWQLNQWLRVHLGPSAANFRIAWTAGSQPRNELEFVAGVLEGRCHVHATIDGEDLCIELQNREAPGPH